MGDIIFVQSAKTEFDTLWIPAPLSFKSFIISSISLVLAGKKTNAFTIRLLKNYVGFMGELGNWLV